MKKHNEQVSRDTKRIVNKIHSFHDLHQDRLKAHKRRIKKINWLEGKVYSSDAKITLYRKDFQRYKQHEQRK